MFQNYFRILDHEVLTSSKSAQFNKDFGSEFHDFYLEDWIFNSIMPMNQNIFKLIL